MTSSSHNFREMFAKKSWRVEASLTYSFDIRYSTNVFDPQNGDLIEFGDSRRRIVVIDKMVDEIYGDVARAYFMKHQIEVRFLSIECNEERKDFDNLNIILAGLEDFGLLRRAEPIICVGGGVLLDLAGFAASVYRRGVPYIRVPTTLLALVDASVGAKTGINHFNRRNRLGTYYPPAMSYLDKTFVKTQDNREISNGLAEIFKLALIKDAELFNLLEGDAENLIREKFQHGAVPVRVINRAVTGMVEELAPNLWEKNLERSVDFGHSFSPLVEMNALPELLHGEAVCLDVLYSSYIAFQRGLIERSELDRIVATARRLGLKTWHPYFGDVDMLVAALADTTKHRNGCQNLPLPFGIGSYIFANDLTREQISEASIAMRQEQAG